MQGSHCHHTIKQSSASPNSLQLSSAGTRHSHYNKHSLLMLRLHHTHTHARTCTHTIPSVWKKKVLCLIGRSDSWIMKLRTSHTQNNTQGDMQRSVEDTFAIDTLRKAVNGIFYKWMAGWEFHNKSIIKLLCHTYNPRPPKCPHTSCQWFISHLDR